jgi:hypothetical protein
MEPIYIPILLGAIFVIAIGVSYLMQIGTLSMREWKLKISKNLSEDSKG